MISRRGFLQAVAAAASYALVSGCQFGTRPYVPPTTRREVPPIKDELRLIAVGDWGDASSAEFDTIAGMDAASAALAGFHGGLFLGDNFYPDGVKSVDDELWRTCFVEPFDTEQLGNLTWQAVLGNHDWHGNVQAQIDYSKKSKRWNMPDHYWRKDYGPAGENPLLTVLGIDTNKELKSWKAQIDWLESHLRELRSVAWPRVVIGHHTLVSYSNHGFTDYMMTEFEPMFSKYGVSAYLCGHDHGMQICEKHGVTYAVLGGGGAGLYNVENGPLSKFSARSHGFGVLRVTRKQFAIECRDTSGKILHTQTRVAA